MEINGGDWKKRKKKKIVKRKVKKKKSIKRKETSIRDLWDNIINCPSIQIIGIPEEDKMNEHEKA